MVSPKHLPAYLLLAFGTGALISFPIWKALGPGPIKDTSVDLEEFQNTYKFINPLLACGDAALSRSTSNISKTIESKVGAYIDAQKASGAIGDAAVYYRDLKNGPWALINGDLMSTPGSLLKVPLVLSIYRHAPKEPGFLEKKLKYEGVDNNAREFFRADESVKPGSTHTISELIKYTLVDSDNNAALLLSQTLSPVELVDSFAHLGIESPDLVKGAYAMNVRTYASFFRVLYNGSYLDRDSSEHLLGLLAQSKFSQGLVSGTPKQITVSHKFGEAEFPNGETQLHDCGIVYKADEPYILCVMTHGTNPQNLANAISDIAGMVYDIVDADQGDR